MDWGAILPLLAATGGYLLRLFTEWLRDDRNQAREDRRRQADFQRATVLELQQALRRQSDAFEVYLSHRIQTMHRFGHWGVSVKPAPQDEQVANSEQARAELDVLMLNARVSDERLRDLVKRYTVLNQDCRDAIDYQEAMQARADALDHLEAAIERAGEIARTTP